MSLWEANSTITAYPTFDLERIERRADPKNDWRCSGIYKWWSCYGTDFTTVYSGCCAENACRHGASCPESLRQPWTLTVRPPETVSSTPPPTTTEDEPHTETETATTFITSTIPVKTTFTTTAKTTDLELPPVETLAAPEQVEESKSIGAIVGGALGGTAGVILLICVAIVFFRRRRRLVRNRRKTPVPGGLVLFLSSSEKRTDPDPRGTLEPMGDMYVGIAEKSNSEKPSDEKTNPEPSGKEPGSPFPSEKSTLVASPPLNKSPSIESGSRNNSPRPDNAGPPSPTSASELPGFQPYVLPDTTPELPATVPLPHNVVCELSGTSAKPTNPPTLPQKSTVDTSIELEDSSKKQSQGQAPTSEHAQAEAQAQGQGQGQPHIAELDQDPGRSELPVESSPLTITTPEGVVLNANLHTRQESHVMSFMQYPTGPQ